MPSRIKAHAGAIRPRGFGRVRSVAGRHRDVLSNWRPVRTLLDEEAHEREVIARRAEDLCDNDPHAASVIDGMATNIVGQGQRPQSKIIAKRLNLTEDEAEELRADQERVWNLWCQEAHAGERAFYGDLEFLSMHSLLMSGEWLYVPRMLDDPGRTFSLALQDVHPSRLSTPSDFSGRSNIHDGVEVDDLGRPQAYWICNPTDNGVWFGERMSSANYVRIPARIVHRPGMMHGYRFVRMEQFRGRSVLAPAMKTYRLLGDSWDYELIGQIIAASFPVFISSQNPQAAAFEAAMNGSRISRQDQDNDDIGQQYASYAPGQVLYGNLNEKAQILESNRPGNNFKDFSLLNLRAMAAATGVSYEVLTKDFSQTNYSSVRAALLEAWRVFQVYRSFARNRFNQICWNMVQEEAFLRGLWKVPAKAPDFYDTRADYLSVRWIGPARGYVDPVKEILAYVKGLDANIYTHSDVIAEQGGDWEETFAQRGREQRRLETEGLSLADAGATTGAAS